MIGTDKQKGYEIANTIVRHAAALGAQYVIFDDYEWSSDSHGPAWELQRTSQDRAAWGRGPNSHADHVHIELTPEAAADGSHMTAVLSAVDQGLSPSPRPELATSTTAPYVPWLAIGVGACLLTVSAIALWSASKRRSLRGPRG